MEVVDDCLSSEGWECLCQIDEQSVHRDVVFLVEKLDQASKENAWVASTPAGTKAELVVSWEV